MRNTFGQNVAITLFGESHGDNIGAVLDGMPPGLTVDTDFIKSQLSLRRPTGAISTPRVENDDFTVESGIFNGKTTGAPIMILIKNQNKKSGDYSQFCSRFRPGHADYTAFEKYSGFNDYRGGGHFSGRLTAPIVAAGALAISALKQKGIVIGTHIKKCGGVSDDGFTDLPVQLEEINKKQFAVINDSLGERMKESIVAAGKSGDSVGGILETAVVGVPVGVGEPWFDSVESVLSHALFSIPALKGVEFGDGFGLADMLGSQANDELRFENSRIITTTNSNGGINGGISNGMPIVFRTVIKPTPTISKPQNSVDIERNENTVFEGVGRHDPCIVHRARVVVDSITALVLCDLLTTKYGNDWLCE